MPVDVFFCSGRISSDVAPLLRPLAPPPEKLVLAGVETLSEPKRGHWLVAETEETALHELAATPRRATRRCDGGQASYAAVARRIPAALERRDHASTCARFWLAGAGASGQTGESRRQQAGADGQRAGRSARPGNGSPSKSSFAPCAPGTATLKWDPRATITSMASMLARGYRLRSARGRQV